MYDLAYYFERGKQEARLRDYFGAHDPRGFLVVLQDKLDDIRKEAQCLIPLSPDTSAGSAGRGHVPSEEEACR